MTVQVKLEGDINQGIAYYKKALYYNWHYADAMYNLGVAYGEMLKFDMVSNSKSLVDCLILIFKFKLVNNRCTLTPICAGYCVL